ncbi:hypothetical protein H6P81_014331 [Aristolochia fimbriata]|uniref:Plant bHLH transcription factor ACT-like domain-containing protein n=1 Tax=Aristolochia fimbriata TaxID=158543 RepID=A0AAV7ELT2_ARIFI|nr:hypothetical protein H6P81_014331 [Aristolochia fimbriata]
MVYRVRRGVALRRNFHVLRSITTLKSMRRNSVIKDALNYIKELKLKIEAMNEECQNPKEVMVERIDLGFLVRVSCAKGQEALVKILGAFEEVGLNVLQATVSCNDSLFMEAIVEAADGDLEASALKRALLEALIAKKGEINMISPVAQDYSH